MTLFTAITRKICLRFNLLLPFTFSIVIVTGCTTQFRNVASTTAVFTNVSASQNIPGGTPYVLQWNSAGYVSASSKIALDYSTDSGNTWTSITSGISNSGNYSWKTPPINSINAQVRLTATDTSGNISVAGFSPTFAIVPTADQFLGTDSLTSNLNGRTSVNILAHPYVDGSGRLWVADSVLNRVMMWNTPPSSYTDAPDLMMGSKGFMYAGVNGGNYGPSGIETVSDWTLSGPRDVCVSGNNVVISDANNNRILIWNAIPTKSGVSANVVLGQPDFTTADANHGGISASTISAPMGILCQGGKLYVTDTGNNRVLIWNSIPTSNFTAADEEIGQPDFVTATANTGGRTGARFSKAEDLTTDGTNLFVVDTSNHRVLMWPTLSPATGSAATMVLGQGVSFTTSTNGTSNIKFKAPTAIDIIAGKMYLTDTSNQRILIWDTVPTATNTAATRELGQVDLNTAGYGTPANNNFSQPLGIAATAGGKFYTTDGTWTRMLIFDTPPAGNNAGADAVYGQTSFLTSSPAGSRTPDTTATYFTGGYSGSQALVPDSSHCRVLLWNNSANMFSTPPDVVIGQANYQSAICQVTPTSSSIRSAGQSSMEGSRLAIADRNNNRILLWNTAPTSNNAPADIALGQPDFVTATQNTGGISTSSLSNPFATIIYTGKVIVADSNNNRVLIWNTWPTINNQSADVVLGQALSTTANVNDGGVSASSLSTPHSLFVYQGKLFVADSDNNRILVWNSIPTVNNQKADQVIGQPDAVTILPYFGTSAINAQGFSSPGQIYYNGGKFFVSDVESFRMMIWNSFPKTGDSASTIVGLPAASLIHDISADPSATTTASTNGFFMLNQDLWISDSFWRTVRFPGYGE